jgi:hypothetical protein
MEPAVPLATAFVWTSITTPTIAENVAMPVGQEIHVREESVVHPVRQTAVESA